MNGKTKFLNVDLEVRREAGLDDLIDALEASCFVMDYDEGKWASLELNEEPQSPADAISKFHAAIMALEPSQRALWDETQKRCFNIGIHAGAGPHQAFFRLSPETLALVAALKAEVTFTIYGANEDLG